MDYITINIYDGVFETLLIQLQIPEGAHVLAYVPKNGSAKFKTQRPRVFNILNTSNDSKAKIKIEDDHAVGYPEVYNFTCSPLEDPDSLETKPGSISFTLVPRELVNVNAVASIGYTGNPGDIKIINNSDQAGLELTMTA